MLKNKAVKQLKSHRHVAGRGFAAERESTQSKLSVALLPNLFGAVITFRL
jgi:hypothetical protein